MVAATITMPVKLYSSLALSLTLGDCQSKLTSANSMMFFYLYYAEVNIRFLQTYTLHKQVGILRIPTYMPNDTPASMAINYVTMIIKL